MKGKFLLSYLDYYLYLITVFVTLFALAFYLISEENKQGNVTEKAEFIIELTWENGSSNDLDLWVSGPENNIVFFRHKDGKVIILDRDDIGINSSMVTTLGVVSNDARREVATIRKVIPGEYIVNVMMYNNRTKKPEKATVTIRKLNPYNEIVEKTIELSSVGEEQTILTFNLDADGNVISKSDEPVSLFRRAP